MFPETFANIQMEEPWGIYFLINFGRISSSTGRPKFICTIAVVIISLWLK